MRPPPSIPSCECVIRTLKAVFASVKETSMRVVRAAAVQMRPVLYSREATVEKVVRKIHELGQQGVQFVTFAAAHGFNYVY